MTLKWQIYITDASRRFIIFMSSIRSKFGTIESDDEKDIYDNGNTKNEKFISMMKELMPPLDVIMVWHSFLLNLNQCMMYVSETKFTNLQTTRCHCILLTNLSMITPLNSMFLNRTNRIIWIC